MNPQGRAYFTAYYCPFRLSAPVRATAVSVRATAAAMRAAAALDIRGFVDYIRIPQFLVAKPTARLSRYDLKLDYPVAKKTSLQMQSSYSEAFSFPFRYCSLPPDILGYGIPFLTEETRNESDGDMIAIENLQNLNSLPKSQFNFRAGRFSPFGGFFTIQSSAPWLQGNQSHPQIDFPASFTSNSEPRIYGQYD
ncbi:hypothetical protein C8R44DRAFT_728876 [Mycena epipterygia]|nr:hypothetical protein C8R44DRAFT_728876 [Mycena epipterygia]